MFNTKELKQLCHEYTILLVDDEESARAQVRDILSLLFKKVYIAQDGVEALELYKQNKVDLILTDLTMPNMNGFELIDAIRERYPKQKIIVMSAHAESGVIVNTIKLDVDAYIVKPVESLQMFEALQKAVESLKEHEQDSAYQEQLEVKVEQQAQELVTKTEIDTLTELPNKDTLCKILHAKNHPYSELLILNIDNFEQINATYGYTEGDLALIEISEFLKEIVDENLFRGNGDEFIIVVPKDAKENALALAYLIKRKVYSKRFEISSTAIRITFSIGVVAISPDDKELPYTKAQLALADTRRMHKNAIGHYYEDSEAQNYQQKMHEWAHKLKLALDFDLLVPYYQPIVNTQTGEISKYECLARIIEQDNPISPYRFIEPARIAGMVSDITRRIIIKAFETFSNSTLEFSINITDDDFKEEYLIDYLQENCEKYAINPSQVVLEVLENISDYDATHAISQMNELKALGYQISIDDFGAESSNFARLQNIEVDYIKIDGSFIKDIATCKNSLIITKTIIFYAQHSEIKTIAEFVHNKETYDIVKSLGVDFVQGYYLDEPLKQIK